MAGAVGLFDDDAGDGGGSGGIDVAGAAGAPPPDPSPLPGSTGPASAVDGASQLAGGAPAEGAPGLPETSAPGDDSLWARLLSAPLVEPPVQVGWISQRAQSSSADPVLPGGGVLDDGNVDGDGGAVTPVAPESVGVALVEEGRALDSSARAGAGPVAVAVEAPDGLAVSAAQSPEVRVEVVSDDAAR